jgi:hypothetical protein
MTGRRLLIQRQQPLQNLLAGEVVGTAIIEVSKWNFFSIVSRLSSDDNQDWQSCAAQVFAHNDNDGYHPY